MEADDVEVEQLHQRYPALADPKERGDKSDPGGDGGTAELLCGDQWAFWELLLLRPCGGQHTYPQHQKSGREGVLHITTQARRRFSVDTHEFNHVVS